MNARKIPLENASIRILSGSISFIDKYNSGVITYDDLPIPVDFICSHSKEVVECELVHVLPFKESIPSILLFICEGSDTDETVQSILDRTNRTHVNQLALYVYGPRTKK